MIICIVGPTAVGKTKLSVELAKIYNGEIINADSMQIYKGLDIGTAKVTKEEMQHIKHHLLSIKEVEEDYTVFDYQKDARKKIDEIKSKGKIPILVGGTGYYIKSALYDYEFNLEEIDNKSDYNDLSNEEINRRIDNYECGFIYDRDNRQRIIRLLNKLENGWFPEQKEFKLIYPDVIFIGLTTDREKLYERINERFDNMIIPLIDEVKPYALANNQSKSLMTGIGYKELFPFFNNEDTLVNVVNECKKNSRNYAKRQYTWFKNQMEIDWLDVDFNNFDNTINKAIELIEQKNNDNK
jgi:tRNA dimethylallyltransferase